MGEIQSKIIKLLRKKNDLTINAIADSINVDRHTAAKNLEILKGQGLIEYRESGKSKLWSISESPLLNSLKHTNQSSININSTITHFKDILGYVDDDINIQSRDLNTLWSNRISDHRKCFERVGLDQKCKNCPIEKTFKTGKSESEIVMMNNQKVKIVTKPIRDNNDNIIAVVEIIKRNFADKSNKSKY